MLAKGSYSELGKLRPPTYDGRWEVIRRVSSVLHDRDYIVICTLTEPQRQDGVLYLVVGGPFAPVGEWVLELMRSADAQNVEYMRKVRDKLWAQNDALEAARDRLDEGAAREAIDHQVFEQNYAGHRGRWHGQGADFDANGRILTPSSH